jgi:glycosyltransferase involved in cell wall biosynthesis
MRVLFIISELTFGGAQKQVVELARQLVKNGHHAAIYTLNREVPRAPELEGSGVTLVVDQKRQKLDPAVLWRLRRFMRAWRPDIAHGFLYDGDIYARIAAFGTGIPVLNSERNDAYEISRTQKLAHWLTKWLVDGVVANSRSGSVFAQHLYGYDPNHMHVVWNGMRVEDIERRASGTCDYREMFFGPGAHRLAVLVGAIKPSKDYHLAVETAASLVRRAPEWRVLFVGDQLSKGVNYGVGRDSDTGDYKRGVMEHFERLAIGDKVKFAGLRDDVHAIVAQGDVLFVTSRNEGFPNSVLEAMILGVPVVSTDYSDIRHILPRAEQVVGQRDPGAIAAHIIDASLDRTAIAAEQKRWVRANATIETATRNLERVYSNYLAADAYAHPA